MVIIPHMLVGAVIGAKIKHIGLIIVLALLSHTILDKIPHYDYGYGEIKRFQANKSYKILFIHFLKLAIDGLIGLLIISSIIWYKNIIKLEYLLPISIGILVSILPDIFLGTSVLFKQDSKKFMVLYRNIAHHPRKRRKPTLFRIGTQILVSIITILILIFS